MQQASAIILLAALLGCAAAQGGPPGSGPLWAPVNEGSATVASGGELLAALSDNVGNITLASNIYLTQADWSGYELPIILSAPDRTILVQSDTPGVMRTLDWGHAFDLLNVTSNTTLAFNWISSEHPGNRTKGVESMEIEIKGSGLWPTVTGQVDHKIVVANSVLQMDISKCNPDFVELEAQRIQQQLEQYGAPGKQLVQYTGGVNMSYVLVPFPASLFSGITKQQIARAQYTLANVTTTCYDSSYVPHHDDGGGVPAWVWALVGSVVGCALLALVGVGYLWRRKRRLQQDLVRASSLDEEARISKADSTAELASHPSTAFQASHDKSLGLAKAASDELHSQFMRARFGPIDGVQLGELLGRGAFGRVFRGRWKGAVVAVKVIDHRVLPGKTHDLSREPLLSMSVSHPNVVITHKMCVVKVTPNDGDLEAAAAATGPSSGSTPSSSAGQRSSSGGKLVPAIAGTGMVEIVSPHDVLQPGMYETWLVCEFCDRGSMADLMQGGKLPTEAAQRDIWVVLSLLDVALGLEYLHSSTIIHGDLKPANVMLKAARNDRRGFVCKLGDFGLSRMLGNEDTHVQTQSYGTASYAAPELLSHGLLTKACDIYSFAIIIWELVSGGQELYPGLTVMQVILQVSQHQQRPEVPDGCPPRLAALMQRCWNQDAAQRPTAAELVEDLRQQLMAMMRPAAQQPQVATQQQAGLSE